MTNHDNYSGNESYSDYPTGPIGTETDSKPKEKAPSRVSLPTVLASAGVAAVISALIMSIGLVGVMMSNASHSNGAAETQPTVVNLGAATQPQQDGGTPAPQNAPTGSNTSTTPTPAAEDVPESGGGGDNSGGDNSGGGTGNDGGGNTNDGGQNTPAQNEQPNTPQALTPGQLNTKVNLIMNTGASRAARADELEGGQRAVQQIDAVSTAIAAFGNVGFSYRMIDPVAVNGNNMTGTLQMTVVGRGSQNQELVWVWAGDKWKLTNKSTCDVAALVLLPCSL